MLQLLKVQSWNAAGVTLPGVPGVVIGKGENISWVLTNVMNDDADFYFEKLDSSKTKYFFDGQWQNLKIIKDTIKVKDGKDQVITIKETHRGPIISNIHPFKFIYNKDESYIFHQLVCDGLEMNSVMRCLHFIKSTKQKTGMNFVML